MLICRRKTVCHFVCLCMCDLIIVYVCVYVLSLVVYISLAGWVLIDRSGKYFGTILNFLRDGSVSLPETKKECLELAAEAK